MAGPIGEPSYNEGLIGNGPPIGKDSYNRGRIGKGPPIGSAVPEGSVGDAEGAGISAYNYDSVGGVSAGIDAYNRGSIGEPTAGVDAYNRETTGVVPTYPDSYNRNLIGSAPNYADAYNRSLVGSVPNYPSPYNRKNVGSNPNYPDPYNKGTVGDDNPSYSSSYNFGLRGLGKFQSLSGSKPKALHTEYASAEADWDAAYHGDLVFYMVRADEGGVKDKEFDNDYCGVDDQSLWDPTNPDANPSSTPTSPDPGNTIPANAQAGPNAPALQTAPQQVAASSTTGMTSAGPAGPSTGANRSSVSSQPQQGSGRAVAGQGQVQERSLEAPVGFVTQASARYSTQSATAANITQAVNSLSNNEIIRNYPGSEVFFTDLLHASFNPGVARSATRSPQEIEVALERPKLADLSIALAYASGGIRSSANLIQGINKGDIGLVTPKTMAQAERFGPQVANTRYTR